MKLLKQVILNTRVTKNNRRYPVEVLESIKDQINKRDKDLNIGTIGYPTDLIVSLSDSAFRYSNAVIENEILYADIETIHTPKGVELRNMIDNEEDIRFRPGGMSTLKGGIPSEVLNLIDVPNEVCIDYKLITISSIQESDDVINFQKMLLKNKSEIENYEEKAKLLRENGWTDLWNEDNWVKKEWFKDPTIDIDRAGGSTDEVYSYVKNRLNK